MNRDQNLVAFLGFFIFWAGIGRARKDAESTYDKFDETIVTTYGGNATLLCNPSLRENSTLSSLASNFEWNLTTETERFGKVLIFSNGKLPAFLFEKDPDNSSFAIDSNPPATLILRKIWLDDALLTCTFSTPETKVSYTYYLKVNGRKPESYIVPIIAVRRIGLKERGHQVQLDCNVDVEQFAPWPPGYYWLSRKSKPGEDVQDVEVISLNRSVVLKNSTGFQVAENGSLIIDNFSPVWKTTFECHVSNGYEQRYSLDPNFYNESIIGTTESRHWAVTNQKKQNISVTYGTRNVVLPCPPKYNITNSSYLWTFKETGLSSSELLFVDQKKLGYKLQPFTDFYEIKDNGSLLIVSVKMRQYGRYVCQTSIGEQYIYDLNRGSKTRSETISIKGKSNVTLPCPLEDQVDRDNKAAAWSSKSKNINGSYETIYFSNEIPGKAKRADDKTSLIVSNLTSSSIDDEYECELYYSGNRYTYRFIN